MAGWLHQDAAARLFRQGGQDLAALTAAAARRGFRPVPLTLQLDATVRSTIRRSETENVLARWPGRGALAREAVLIGGHYDHFGIGAPVNGDSIYNGAEDNASGHGGSPGHRGGVRPERRPPRALAGVRGLRGRGVGPDRLAGPGDAVRRSRSVTWRPS